MSESVSPGKVNDLAGKLELFFNSEPANRASATLVEGASFRISVDGDVYSMTKVGNSIIIKAGEPSHYIVELKISGNGLEYILESDDDNELRKRVGECLLLKEAGKSLSVRLNTPGRVQSEGYFHDGYHFWARRMNLVT